MSLSAGSVSHARAGRSLLRPLAIPLAVTLVLVLCLPMLGSRHANLTSDESLYLAEAYNLAHGKGLTYPSGDPVTHRAPLFPLALAPAVRLAGPDAAYGVTRAIVALNAVLVLMLAWRLAGGLAGAIAGVAAAASAFLGSLGTTLYLDPFECTFMLLCLLALREATRGSPQRWCAAAGACLGLAFLVKESAVQWAPLGVAAWICLPSLRCTDGARGALLFTLALAATAVGWWVWVWAESGQVFMLGAADARGVMMLGAAVAGVGSFAVAIAVWPRVDAARRSAIERATWPAAALLIVGWGAFMLLGLTRYATWPYPNDYVQTVPRYLNTVAPQAQPYLLLAAAWIWVAAAWRRNDAARLLGVAGLLFLPFALFAANRGLQLRDALPLVYLAYVVLGIAAASVLGVVRRNIRQPMGDVLMAAALVAFGGAFAFQQATLFRVDNDAAASIGVRADSWDSVLVGETAAWMDANLPAGSRVLANRLYFSSLYVHTGGRFPVRQLPTVRVDIDPSRQALLAPRSNLFRWGDTTLRAGRPGDEWLYLKQFPVKDYWVGMSQQELLQYIQAHEIDAVVLTGEDAAFSTLAYADYFSGHPAFALRYTKAYSPSDQVFVYSVDRSKLAPAPHSTVISPASIAALEAQTGLSPQELATALGTPLRVSDSDRGLSDRERWAAIAGIDLGAR